MAELVAAGLLALVGLGLLAGRVPLRWRPRLADRVLPYLSAATPSSRLLAGAATLGPWSALAGDLAWFGDWLLGGRASVQRRLDLLGPDAPSRERFRQQQLLAGAAGGLLGLALLAARLGGAGGVPVPSLAGASVGLVALGVFARDRALTTAVRRRQERLAAQLPAAADLLALAVSAGEPPAAALARVARVTAGELGTELDRVLSDVRAGAGLADALGGLLSRTDTPAVARFVDGLRVAVARGTPLAEVLRAQAADARESFKRSLLEAGGRNEVRMLVPVVFLILPVTLLFALYPVALTLTSLTH